MSERRHQARREAYLEVVPSEEDEVLAVVLSDGAPASTVATRSVGPANCELHEGVYLLLKHSLVGTLLQRPVSEFRDGCLERNEGLGVEVGVYEVVEACARALESGKDLVEAWLVVDESVVFRKRFPDCSNWLVLYYLVVSALTVNDECSLGLLDGRTEVRAEKRTMFRHQ